MSLVNRTLKSVALLSVIPLFGGSAPRPSTRPQLAARLPESPAFAAVTVGASQSLRLNVVCFAHQVGLLPPDPCRGTVMFHDAAGEVVGQGTYALKPGEGTRFVFVRAPSAVAGVPVFIIPCVLPAAGSGRAVPTAEVFDNTTGRTSQYINPAAGRASGFSNGRFIDPGSIVGFNPQPDPPGFGLVTLLPGQAMRGHLACPAHGDAGSPPDPCRGTVMFHDAAGNVLQSSTYELKPGQIGTFAFAPRETTAETARAGVAIDPCWIPSPGGRGVPSIEVFDQAGTIVSINPAVSRMSEIDR